MYMKKLPEEVSPYLIVCQNICRTSFPFPIILLCVQIERFLSKKKKKIMKNIKILNLCETEFASLHLLECRDFILLNLITPMCYLLSLNIDISVSSVCMEVTRSI